MSTKPTSLTSDHNSILRTHRCSSLAITDEGAVLWWQGAAICSVEGKLAPCYYSTNRVTKFSVSAVVDAPQCLDGASKMRKDAGP